MKAEIIFPLSTWFVCYFSGSKILDMNSNFRQFLSNLSIWAIIVLAIATGYQGYFYFLVVEVKPNDWA